VARLPIPPIGDDYNKNRQQQYEALGRFVEAFENLVDTFRDTSLKILSKGDDHARLVNIFLHHSALTAKPLFDIMRALIIDFLRQQPQSEVSIKEREGVAGVLNVIATECQHLWEVRNSLLHGTWKVGYLSWDDPNSTKFILDKYKPTKTGLRRQEGLPEDAFELMDLGDRCNRAASWVAILTDCLPIADLNSPEKFFSTFKFQNGKWHLTFRNTVPESLL
jgi:hypothetical protein